MTSHITFPVYPLLIAVPFGPLLAWKRGDLLAAAQRLTVAAIVSLAAIIIVGLGLVVAAGPVPMMKFVSKMTEGYGVHTLVSLNSIMVDGTGMCGSCRVTVGGDMKFACVDGPEFDGHQVNFDELMLRLRAYCEEEKRCYEDYCRMTGK